MHINEFEDGHVEVTYIRGYTGHELGICDLPHLSIPASIRETVAMKISLGIPAERIMEDKKMCLPWQIHSYIAIIAI